MSDKPETKELELQTADIVLSSQNFAIATAEDMTRAGEFLRQIKTVRANIAKLFDPHIKRAHESHKALLADKKSFDGPMEQAERAIKGRVAAYTTEQERIRRERELELQRKAQEAEEARRLAEAEALESAGRNDEAEAVIAAPVIAPPAMVKSTVPKVEGVKMMTVWKFRIIDETKIPRMYLQPNEQAIRAHGRSMREKANIPGVEFFPDEVCAVAGY